MTYCVYYVTDITAVASVTIFICLRGTAGNEDAKRLHNHLMDNYNRLVRPVSNSSERLTVKLGLKLSQLIGVVRSLCADIANTYIKRLRWLSWTSSWLPTNLMVKGSIL